MNEGLATIVRKCLQLKGMPYEDIPNGVSYNVGEKKYCFFDIPEFDGTDFIFGYIEIDSDKHKFVAESAKYIYNRLKEHLEKKGMI